MAVCAASRGTSRYLEPPDLFMNDVISPKSQCDESRPCYNCVKYGLDCSLVSHPARIESLSRGLRQAEAGQAGTAPTVADSTTTASECYTSPKTNDAVRHSKISRLRELISSLSSEVEALEDSAAARSCDCHDAYVEDLQLMHHFSVSAVFTVVDDQTMLEAWQSSAPRPSLSNARCIPHVWPLLRG